MQENDWIPATWKILKTFGNILVGVSFAVERNGLVLLKLETAKNNGYKKRFNEYFLKIITKKTWDC